MTEPSTKALDAAERVVAACDVLADIIAVGFDEFVIDIRTLVGGRDGTHPDR